MSTQTASPETGTLEAARMAKRAETFDDVLLSFRAELDVDRFASAIGKFREAVNLSRAWEELRVRLMRAAAEESKKLLPRNWRVAEAVLSETKGLESPHKVPSELWDKIQLAKHDEAISNALYAVDRTELTGSIADAKTKVERLLLTYPGEARLLERLAKIEEQLKPKDAKAEEAPVAAPVEARKPQSVPTPDVPLEEQEETPAAEPVPMTRVQRIKVLIPSELWERVKTSVTVVATTAMVAAAAILVWLHFAHPRPVHAPLVPTSGRADNISPKQPTATPPSPNGPAVDEKDWRAIRLSERSEDMELFLRTHPLSPHAYRARVKLSALLWEKVDKNNPDALRAYLEENPDGMHAKAAKDQLAALANRR